MNSYILTCCSTVDLSKEYLDKRGIPYVCFHFNIDGTEYPDDLGQSMPFDQFYAKIQAGAMPTTSLVNTQQFLDTAVSPIKEWMLMQTTTTDVDLFKSLSIQSGQTGLENLAPQELPLTVVIPSFIISELKRAFLIGFLLFIPFLIIDMIVSSVLMSMGMMMLPPVMISLPFKLMLFVVVDGWGLLVKTLIMTYN